MSRPTDIDIAHRVSPRLWIVSAFAAIVLHAAGIAVAVAEMKADDADDDLGAPALEVGVELTAMRQEPTDLPPGPDSDASQASPEMPEQKAELKQTDLPKDVPTESEDPDQVVSPNDAKKVDEDAKLSTEQSVASQQSVASEAMAAPSSEQIPQGPKSTAPVQGVGNSVRREILTWQKALIAHFDKHKRYPPEHRRPEMVEILVSFELDRIGHVLSASIAKGSGDAAFDEAALDMVRRSDPVPLPPPAVADEGLTFTMPVRFRAKGG
jgi:TonB family protein